ncbi:hypothetical protein PLICRDRAFT_551792 [Plicaturopsis crispa FD-325 SS-3]|nr:hypothetical protein PLICRDRAFT_551792 [Plicaturopsis crispa FD-325 SS-3]
MPIPHSPPKMPCLFGRHKPCTFPTKGHPGNGVRDWIARNVYTYRDITSPDLDPNHPGGVVKLSHGALVALIIMASLVGIALVYSCWRVSRFGRYRAGRPVFLRDQPEDSLSFNTRARSGSTYKPPISSERSSFSISDTTPLNFPTRPRSGSTYKSPMSSGRSSFSIFATPSPLVQSLSPEDNLIEDLPSLSFQPSGPLGGAPPPRLSPVSRTYNRERGMSVRAHTPFIV